MLQNPKKSETFVVKESEDFPNFDSVVAMTFLSEIILWILYLGREKNNWDKVSIEFFFLLTYSVQRLS